MPAQSAQPVVREIQQQGYRVRLDLSPQVLHLSVPEQDIWGLADETVEETIYPTPRALGRDVGNFFSGETTAFFGGDLRKFVPAGLLLHKAKQFDDGLYAAVELAVQRGETQLGGKGSLLSALVQAMTARAEARDASVLLLAACHLGGVGAAVPADLASAVADMVRRFLADEQESKPLGFYTWSAELEAIFRQDRLLQQELPDHVAQALVDALRGDAGLAQSYERLLAFGSSLTNPAATPDLRRSLAEPRPTAAGASRPRLFPPSASHEGVLAQRLFGNRPIPEGASLIDEMIRAIRASTLRLEPREDSGWYDYQTWAHEPLVVPDATPEMSHLRLDESYRKELLELFKGAQALARETHVKALLRKTLGLAGVPEPRRPVISVTPDLTVEPLATLYRRRAAGYRFIRRVLDSALGAPALRQMRRLTAEGPIGVDLDTDLSNMETLFKGAYATVCAQIGLPTDPIDGDVSDARSFVSWVHGLDNDPDLGRDTRMMVPIFYDDGRQATKAWVFLGWVARTLRVDFATPPAVEVFDAGGRPVAVGKVVDLDFKPEVHTLLSPVMAEVYVTRLLNREEFRAHCDRLQTRSAILSALE